jgi:hypothetical protein
MKNQDLQIMKKAAIIISVFILTSIINIGTIKAQERITGEKYFIGKWNLMIYGVPDGDTKIVINIEKKEDKLSGSMADPSKSDPPLELSNIEIADSTFKATFNAQGMDIALMLKIKDDKNVTGNMMDMFDIKGIKEK